MTDKLTGVGGTTSLHIPERARAEAPAAEAAPQPVAQVENHMSPMIHVDTESGLATLQFRDRQTGEVQDEVPNPRRVKELLTSYHATATSPQNQAAAAVATVAAGVKPEGAAPKPAPAATVKVSA